MIPAVHLRSYILQLPLQQQLSCTHHIVPPISLLRAYSQVGGFFNVKPAYVT